MNPPEAPVNVDLKRERELQLSIGGALLISVGSYSFPDVAQWAVEHVTTEYSPDKATIATVEYVGYGPDINGARREVRVVQEFMMGRDGMFGEVCRTIVDSEETNPWEVYR